jgi:hypothetical protein
MAKRSTASIQLIVRRGARQRFQKLRKKTANLPATVAWDRRQQDRRSASDETAADRRTKDRRRKPPFTWEVSDFVVVEKVRPSRKR